MAGKTGWLIWPFEALLQLRGMLFPWVPVFLGLGIGVWFALPTEPGRLAYVLAVLGLCLGGCAARWGPELARPVAVVLAALSLGFLAVGARAHWVGEPMLERPYYGPVQGRIVQIDRSGSDALRITLDRVVMDLPPRPDPGAGAGVADVGGRSAGSGAGGADHRAAGRARGSDRAGGL